MVLDHQKSLFACFFPVPKLQSFIPLEKKKKKRLPYRGRTLLLYFTAALDKTSSLPCRFVSLPLVSPFNGTVGFCLIPVSLFLFLFVAESQLLSLPLYLTTCCSFPSFSQCLYLACPCHLPAPLSFSGWPSQNVLAC